MSKSVQQQFVSKLPSPVRQHYNCRLMTATLVSTPEKTAFSYRKRISAFCLHCKFGKQQWPTCSNTSASIYFMTHFTPFNCLKYVFWLIPTCNTFLFQGLIESSRAVEIAEKIREQQGDDDEFVTMTTVVT